ncbi:MAG: hypothetical protein ACXWAT_00920 [Methylobacter sp.]
MLEAFKIGVSISVIDHASMGVKALSSVFLKTEKDAHALEKRIKSIQSLAIGGGLMLGAGAAGLSLFKAPLEEAKKFQTEAAKFESLGFGDKINTQAQEFAKGMKTVGTSARDNMSIVGDAMAVFKDLNESKMVAPLMAKMKFANEAIFGADGGERDKKLMDMMKVVEFRGGLSSHEEFARQANFAQQAIAGSRNRVDPSMMLQALKTGGVALSSRSNEAFYLGAEPLMQEFGGSRYGTAAMSIYQNLVQARGTMAAQNELLRLGLLDTAKIQQNKLTGKLQKVLPGAFQGSGILEKEGELALLEKVLLPAFAKQGITKDEDVIRELGMILGNRTGSALMSRIYQQREKLHMQTDANLHAENLDQASARASGTAAGKEIELHKALSTLQLNIGQTILPLYVKGLEMLVSGLKSASDWAAKNTGMVKKLAIGFAFLSGAMMISGTVLLLTAAFKGLGLVFIANPIGLTITAIAAAAFLLWKNWDTVGPKLTAAWAAIKSGVDSLVNWIKSAFGFVKSLLPGFITNSHDVSPGMRAPGYHPDTGKPVQNQVSSLLTDKLLGDKPVNKKENSEAAKDPGRYIATKSAPMVQTTTRINLDGRKVAEAVTQHQAKAASRPQSGSSMFDYTMAPPPVGLNYAR